MLFLFSHSYSEGLLFNSKSYSWRFLKFKLIFKQGLHYLKCGCHTQYYHMYHIYMGQGWEGSGFVSLGKKFLVQFGWEREGNLSLISLYYWKFYYSLLDMIGVLVLFLDLLDLIHKLSRLKSPHQVSVANWYGKNKIKEMSKLVKAKSWTK